MFVSVDRYIGKIMFPIIVRICHALDWNQYQLYRYSYTLATMISFFVTWQTGSWFFIFINGLFLFMWVSASTVLNDAKPINQDRDDASLWRFLYVLIAANGFLAFVFVPNSIIAILDIALALLVLGEYAKNIDDLPPKEPRSKLAYN